MKWISYGFIYLIIGIIIINVSSVAFGQEVVELSEEEEDKAMISITGISNGTIRTVEITDSLNFPVKSIEISAKQSIVLAAFSIEIMDSDPIGVEEVKGVVYQYLTIETGLSIDDVSYIKIYFGIPHSWFSTNDINKTLVRLISTSSEGDWDIILTEISEETADEIIFSAPLVNLDTNNYALAEIPPWVATTTLTQIATKTTTLTTDTATVTNTVAANTETVTSGGQGTSTLVYLAIGGAVAAVGILLLVSRSRKRK